MTTCFDDVRGAAQTLGVKSVRLVIFQGGRSTEHIIGVEDLLDFANRQRIKLWGRARVVENDPALMERLVDPGYRVLANIGQHGHQEVPHLHVHLFGGRQFGAMLPK